MGETAAARDKQQRARTVRASQGKYKLREIFHGSAVPVKRHKLRDSFGKRGGGDRALKHLETTMLEVLTASYVRICDDEDQK